MSFMSRLKAVRLLSFALVCFTCTCLSGECFAYGERETSSLIKPYSREQIGQGEGAWELPCLPDEELRSLARGKAEELSRRFGSCPVDCRLYSWNARVYSLLFTVSSPRGLLYESTVYDTQTEKELLITDVLKKGVEEKSLLKEAERFLGTNPAFSRKESGEGVFDGEILSSDFILTDHCLGICLSQKEGDGVVCVLPFSQTSLVAENVKKKRGAVPWEKAIAFTFDDGPTEHTEQILDTLERLGGKGSFFVLGCHVEGNEHILSRMSAMGCEVAIHGYSHSDMRTLSKERTEWEIERTAELIRKACGKAPTLLRAPYGEFTDATAESGLFPIKWSVDTEDWRLQNAEGVAQKILAETKSGDVVLLHDIFPQSAEAFEMAAKELQSQGYRFVTVTELFGLWGEEPKGRIYCKAEE